MRFLALFSVMSAMMLMSSCQTSYAGNTSGRPYGHRNGQGTSIVHTQTPIPTRSLTVGNQERAALVPPRPLSQPTAPAPRPDCAAVCVIDPRTGHILYSHNGKVRRQVASTQKIITALCVCDENRLDKMVTIQRSDNAVAPIRLNLVPGTSYRKRDLLQAMLTGSYNDIAVALARDTAGSVDAFVARMNARAHRMGMRNTHFANPNGLPAAQYSTAEDMARAACYAYMNPVIRECIRVPEFTFVRADGSTRQIRSTNRLLRQHPWVHGMKTGYTDAAGKCLISCGSNNGRAVIVVVLGSTNSKVWGESLKYLRWALSVN